MARGKEVRQQDWYLPHLLAALDSVHPSGGLGRAPFHYKHELDPDSILQFGLLAEQAEKSTANLVARTSRASLTPSATKA
jgi:hypothetical protein